MAQGNMKKPMTMLLVALKQEDELWMPCSYTASADQDDVIGAADRRRVVKWLIALNQEFGFHPEALFMSVSILDRFLNSVKVKPKYLKCVAVTCFYLGVKTTEEDECIPNTRELVQRTGCGCSISEIRRMELCILDKFNWDLRFSTPLNFLQAFHEIVLRMFPDLLHGFSLMSLSQHLHQLTFVLQQCLLHHQLASFAPSVLALALLSLDLEDFAYGLAATFELQKLGEVDHEEVFLCKKGILQCLNCEFSLPYGDQFSLLLEWTPMKQLVEGDDDIYDDIKCLYREEVGDTMQSLLPLTCGSQAARMSSSKPLLKPTLMR